MIVKYQKLLVLILAVAVTVFIFLPKEEDEKQRLWELSFLDKVGKHKNVAFEWATKNGFQFSEDWRQENGYIADIAFIKLERSECLDKTYKITFVADSDDKVIEYRVWFLCTKNQYRL
jgi:hypothetical protein